MIDKIVRSQIPEHVHVVLKQPKVDARRVVIVEISKRSFIQQLRIFRTAPVNRKVWSTMIFRFFCWARLISSSACAALLVNGFSTKTCFPFSSAALVSS